MATGSRHGKAIALPDFEISFGRRTAAGWRAANSTLPWMEGKSIGLRGINGGRRELISSLVSVRMTGLA
jgi:hypothetical protein